MFACAGQIDRGLSGSDGNWASLTTVVDEYPVNEGAFASGVARVLLFYPIYAQRIYIVQCVSLFNS